MARASKKADAPAPTTPQRLGALLKSCRGIMRKDRGTDTDAVRLPQLTWLFFLKFLDDLELRDAEKAKAGSRPHVPIIPAPYRWRDWAADPTGLTGEALIQFIGGDKVLLPDGREGAGLLRTLRTLAAEDAEDRRAVIASVFAGTTNRMIDGYLLRDLLNKVNGIHFNSTDELHTLGALYEGMLRAMRDAAGAAGEFYTPRPLVRLIVEMVDPKIGEVVLDPACGTAGFLVEAFNHMRPAARTRAEREQLHAGIRGQEAKPLPYLLAQMNLLLHGVDVPHVEYGNTLAVKFHELGEDAQVDVILTNPPFGGEETAGIPLNFPVETRTSETALLFLQLIVRRLRGASSIRPGGRAAVVVPEGVLSGGGVSAKVKRNLLESCNLHTVLRLPAGVFAPYTSIPANVLFFEAGGPTSTIWFYELSCPAGSSGYTKTRPLRDEEFEPLKDWWRSREESQEAWRIEWGSERDTAESLAKQDWDRARRLQREARLERDELKSLRGAGALPADIKRVTERVEGLEWDATAAQEAGDALYWPVFNLDRKNPRRAAAESGGLSIGVDELLARARTCVQELEVLATLASSSPPLSWQPTPMGRLVQRRAPDVKVEPGGDYQFAGVKSFGSGVFRSVTRSAEQTSYRELTRLRKGDLVYPKLMAWEGAIGIVPAECDACVVSPEFPVFSVRSELVLEEYLDLFWRSEFARPLLVRGSSGTNVRRRRLHPDAFLRLEIPLPSLDEQARLVGALTRTRLASAALVELSEAVVGLRERMLGDSFAGWRA